MAMTTPAKGHAADGKADIIHPEALLRIASIEAKTMNRRKK